LNRSQLKTRVARPASVETLRAALYARWPASVPRPGTEALEAIALEHLLESLLHLRETPRHTVALRAVERALATWPAETPFQVRDAKFRAACADVPVQALGIALHALSQRSDGLVRRDGVREGSARWIKTGRVTRP
jgi:hypothetical protein